MFIFYRRIYSLSLDGRETLTRIGTMLEHSPNGITEICVPNHKNHTSHTNHTTPSSGMAIAESEDDDDGKSVFIDNFG